MQVGLCYELAFNGEKFVKVCEARTLVNYVIGNWMKDHRIKHSSSVRPVHTMTGDS
jgi:hypothetical protein